MYKSINIVYSKWTDIEHYNDKLNNLKDMQYILIHSNLLISCILEHNIDIQHIHHKPVSYTHLDVYKRQAGKWFIGGHSDRADAVSNF